MYIVTESCIFHHLKSMSYVGVSHFHKFFWMPVTCLYSIRKEDGALDHGCLKLENTLFCCDDFCEDYIEQITFKHQAEALCKSSYILLQISICRSTPGNES